MTAAIVILSILVLALIWWGILVWGAARVLYLANVEETGRRHAAEDELAAERRFSVALETYLPVRPVGGDAHNYREQS